MEVLSWGANSHGQLGQGTVSEQCATPQPVIQTWSGEVKAISGGGGHTLLLNENGWIFACGWNHQQQLGFIDKNADSYPTFTRIWELSGITFDKICTGWDSSAAISDKNVLYLWGANTYGQLGLPKEHFPDAIRPIQLELKGKTISMGLRHTVMVDINDCVWVTGCGKRGQLGLGESILESDTFKKLPSIKNIENAVCGQHHTLAWSKIDNVLYAWGDNTYGQLGLGRELKNVHFPTRVTLMMGAENIVQIFSGWTHSAVLLNDGTAVYWGRNNYGQLARYPLPEGQMYNLLKIKDDKPIEKLSLGSEHSICLTENGSVWAWGWNEHANTGTGSTDNVTEPLKVPLDNKEICDIFTGAGYNFVISR